MNRNRISIIAFAIVVLAVAACSSNKEPAPSGETAAAETSAAAPVETETEGTGLGATEKDFSITLDSEEVASGETTFDIMNEGPSVHEFVVFKTVLAPDALPTDADGAVDEEGKGVTHLGEVEDVQVGATAQLALDLEPGKYVVICNLPGHYAAGMYAGLTVK